MRRTAGAIALGAALTLSSVVGTGAGGVASAAPAQPRSLYPASALVLSYGEGEDAASAPVRRAVTLSCHPTPAGTHPTPRRACAELRAVDGTFRALTARTEHGRVCTKEWRPVTVTAEGVWEGRRVWYEHTFPNPCLKNSLRSQLFGF
ncbi:subtilase-type protease inhibitor [Streptomyces sp. ME19-01-6]|uniref:subtilase-type protease inhibitor n=1 Tax=Streptomyces sp. ME19-01-6 TaxID=3028686 RepID=UPI0029A4CE68|nr:subtilase-type protease inhibitor [Streptomyces sp. ME19-01-6]MDX3231547.1 subtilase-type protease inhibitor [Streptomyces sp. ME19-01-6]